MTRIYKCGENTGSSVEETRPDPAARTIYPVSISEDDGQTWTHHGCWMLVDEGHAFLTKERVQAVINQALREKEHSAFLRTQWAQDHPDFDVLPADSKVAGGIDWPTSSADLVDDLEFMVNKFKSEQDKSPVPIAVAMTSAFKTAMESSPSIRSSPPTPSNSLSPLAGLNVPVYVWNGLPVQFKPYFDKHELEADLKLYGNPGDVVLV